jgi:hypothetical protein
LRTRGQIHDKNANAPGGAFGIERREQIKLHQSTLST